MSIKIADELEPAGESFKVASAKNVAYVNNSEDLSDGGPDNVQDAIDNVQDAIDDAQDAIKILNDRIFSKPELNYLESGDPGYEYGYGRGEIKYWAKDDPMYLKFKLKIVSGAATVVIKKAGKVIVTRSVSKEETDKDQVQTIELGTATEVTEGSVEYTISASSSFGESADDLTLRQAVSNLKLAIDSFDARARRSEVEIDIPETPFECKAGFNNKIYYKIISSLYYLEDGKRKYVTDVTDIEEKPLRLHACSTDSVTDWSRRMQFTGVKLPHPEKDPQQPNTEAVKYESYFIDVQVWAGQKAFVDDENEPKPETYIATTSRQLSFKALLDDDGVAAIKSDTNMTGTKNSNTNLFITYDTETTIDNYRDAGALSAKCVIYEAGSEKIVKQINQSNVTAGSRNTINIGRLPGGTTEGAIQEYSWQIEAWKTDTEEGYTRWTDSGTFSIEEVSETNPVDGAIFTFDATSVDADHYHDGEWYAEKGTDSNTYYTVKLSGINDKTTGFVNDPRGTADWGQMLQLRGKSYGVIQRYDKNTETGVVDVSNFQPFNYWNVNYGITFEAMIKTRNVGVKNAVALSCAAPEGTQNSFKMDYSAIQVAANTSPCSTPYAEDTWVHVAFVINPVIKIPKAIDPKQGSDDIAIEDYNPTPTLNIYINGVRSAVSEFETVANNDYPVYLNCFGTGKEEKPLDGFGETSIKLLRFYDRALTSTEVLKNYINSIAINADETQKVLNKNEIEKTPIPVLYMIRNTWPDASGLRHLYANTSDPTKLGQESLVRSRYDPKAQNEVTFKDLNSIDNKAESKTTRTNCTVWYVYYGVDDKGNNVQKAQKWDDVDVFLQGTSSLVYPVKNYKFKIYKPGGTVGEYEPFLGNRSYENGNKPVKLKTLPFNKTVEDKTTGGYKGTDGWYIEDNTFTLKCDYMEQSHKNNTPTAMFYETVVDEIAKLQVTSEQDGATKYTIAKDIATFKNYSAGADEGVRSYRDGIEGFPILLYYDENDEIGDTAFIDHNKSFVSVDEESGEMTAIIPPKTAQYVGSYMFNTDKTSNSLGFEISIEKDDKDTTKYKYIWENTERFDKDDDGELVFGGLERVDDAYYVLDPTNPAGDTDPTITEEEDEKRFLHDKDGNRIQLTALPMTSMEGKANSNEAAAASWYTLNESNIAKYKSYVSKKYYTSVKAASDKALGSSSQNYMVEENSYLYLCWNNFNYRAHYEQKGYDFNSFIDAAYEGDLAPDETYPIPGFNEFYEAAWQGINNGKNVLKELINNDGIYSGLWSHPDGKNVLPPQPGDNTDNIELSVYSFSVADPEETQKEPTSYYNAVYTPGGKYDEKNKIFILFTDQYAYITNTFETRWSYADELDIPEVSKETKNKMDYGAIVSTLNWFKGLADEGSEAMREQRFRDEFKKHFNFTYALTYYLQMMMFIQVDNAGKNAMFDQWGDGVWYVRPYDMDTQMGLDNSGKPNITASAELNPELSPTNSGGSSTNRISWSTDSTWQKADRLTRAYNTPNSRLWIWFGKYFKKEIQDAYKSLREKKSDGSYGTYSYQNILEFVEKYTSDVIGQKFYNRDGAIKFLAKISPDNLIRLQGCRECSYAKILSERIIFLDSYFDAKGLGSSNTAFNKLSLRAHSTSGIGISVYSPTYIYIDVESGGSVAYAYVDPNDTYKDASGNDVNGVLFTIPITSGNKEMVIYGLESISQIRNLPGLQLDTFDTAEGVLKMVDIDLSETPLSAFSPGNSSYLRSLNLSGCKALTSVQGLSGCLNLESINLSGAGSDYLHNSLSVGLPDGGALTDINLSNTTIAELKISNLAFLTDENLNYKGCKKLKTFIIDNCALLKEQKFNSAEYPLLENITIKNCLGIETVEAKNNLLRTLDLSGSLNIKNIDVSDGPRWISNKDEAGKKYYLLSLTSQSKLEQLNIENCGSPSVPIMLALPTDVLASLKTFNAANSFLSGITYGVPTEGYAGYLGTADFSKFPDRTGSGEPWTLKIHDCPKIVTIENLKYKGDLRGLFEIKDGNVADSNRCSHLKEFKNSGLVSTGTSAKSLFRNCIKLRGLTQTTLDLCFESELESGRTEYVTNFESGLRNCGCLTTADVKYVLSRLPYVEQLAALLQRSGWSSSAAEETSMEIIDITGDMFANNQHIKDLSYAFANGRVGSIAANAFAPIHYTTDKKEQYPLKDCNNMFAWTSYTLGGEYVVVDIPHNIFTGGTDDTKAPEYNVFKYVTTLAGMFQGSAMTNGFVNTDSGKRTFNITYPYDPSPDCPEGNKLTNLSKFFFCCSTLKDSEDESTIDKFFAKFPNVEDISFIFACRYVAYNDKFITGIPEGVFANNKNLKNIDAAFSGITSIVTIPECLFKVKDPLTGVIDPTETHPDLETARGLFAGCTNLIGHECTAKFGETNKPVNIIPKTFFYGAPNIKSLGCCEYNFGNAVRYKCGAFGNTAIKGFDEGFLQCLTGLQDISFLFWKGITDGEINFQTKSSKASLQYLVYKDESGDLYGWDCLIPISIFAGLNILVDCRYAFAGNALLENFCKINPGDFGPTVTIFDDDPNKEGTDSNNIELFSDKSKKTLQNAQGLFQFDTALVSPIPNNLFSDCPELLSVSGCFAECEGLGGKIRYAYSTKNPGEIDINATPPLFRGCEKLRDVSKFFYHCENIKGTDETGINGGEVLPSNLFNDCKATLEKTNGMFFGCKKLSGQFVVDTPQLIWEGTYSTKEKITSDGQSTLYNIKLVLGAYEEKKSESEETELIGNLEFWYQKVGDADWTQDESAETYKVTADNKSEIGFIALDLCKLGTSGDNRAAYNINIPYIKSDYKLTKSDINPSLETDFSNDDVTVTDTFSDVTKAPEEDKYIIKRPGLLSGCKKLWTASEMFAGCKEIHGSIPENMFFMPSGESYEGLQDLSGLFKFCNKLGFLYSDSKANKQHVYQFNGTGDAYLFPDEWLSSMSGELTNIQGIFKLVGNVADEGTVVTNTEGSLDSKPGEALDLPKLKLPSQDPFGSKNIVNASYAFAGMRLLGGSTVGRTFWSSEGAIEDASYMFAVSNIASAGTSTQNALFGVQSVIHSGLQKLSNVSYMFYTGESDQFMENSSFFDPRDYDKILLTGPQKESFITSLLEEKITDANYALLKEYYYVHTHSSTTAWPKLYEVLGTYKDEITDKEYSEKASVSVFKIINATNNL